MIPTRKTQTKLVGANNASVRRGRGACLLALAGMTLGAGACSASGTSGRVPTQTADGLEQAVLGTAQSFAVLGGSTVTNTGATTVSGNVGVDPGLAITGFPPGLVTGGVIHSGDAVALQAQSDLAAAYDTLAGAATTRDLTGQDLGGETLTPGVYRFSSSAQLTGTLTLDAQGDAAAVFVFQLGSTLTTASDSSVVMINGATDCNVFWQVGSSATLGTSTAFKGNLLALASITLDTGATVSGRALARTGAVTMDANQVSAKLCVPAGAVDAGHDGGVDGGSDVGTLLDSGDSAAVSMDSGRALDASPGDATARDVGTLPQTDGAAGLDAGAGDTKTDSSTTDAHVWVD